MFAVAAFTSAVPSEPITIPGSAKEDATPPVGAGRVVNCHWRGAGVARATAWTPGATVTAAIIASGISTRTNRSVARNRR